MSIRNDVIRPSFDEDFEEEENDIYSDEENESGDDEMESISFGALSNAQKRLREEEKQEKRHSLHETNSLRKALGTRGAEKGHRRVSNKSAEKAHKSKHAPAESSSKRPVPRIRDVPGLEKRTLYRDIRFDPAYGKADLHKTRKDYAFLDEYREKEIAEMQGTLRNNKQLGPDERAALEMKVQSLKSRLDTLKNRDLEKLVLSEYKKNQKKNFELGKQTNPFFLKRSEKRKILQKAKFDSMKASQREKVMERKRKKRRAKELKALDFNR